METLPGSPTQDESSFCSVQLTVDQGLPLRPLVNAPICPRLKSDSETSLDLETQDSETAGVVFRSYFVGFRNQSQKLVCRIRNLIVGFRNFTGFRNSGLETAGVVFRSYFVGFRNQSQKLVCRIRNLIVGFRNFTGFRNSGLETAGVVFRSYFVGFGT